MPPNPPPSTKADDKLPKQQLGDTPVAPWEMPTPAEKAKAEPVRQALQQAVEHVDTPEKADEVAERLERAAGARKAVDVAQTVKAVKSVQGGDAVTQSAQAVQRQADKPAAPAEKASDVITKTVEQVAGAQGRDQEVLSQAVQEVLNPEQQGAAPTGELARRRGYLRQAVIKRMGPLDALDARLYLAINHLPHNRWSNGFFYFLTFIYKGGAAWYGLIGLLALFNPKRGSTLVRQVVVPLALSSLTVEFPVKTYVRRRRPVPHAHQGHRRRQETRFVVVPLRPLGRRVWRSLSVGAPVPAPALAVLYRRRPGGFLAHLPGRSLSRRCALRLAFRHRPGQGRRGAARSSG